MLAVLGAACAHPASSEPVPLLKLDWRPVTGLLDSAVAAGAAPGVVVGVTHSGMRFVYGTGRLGSGEAGQPDGNSIYDLASLTKAVGLGTAAMLAVDEGKLELNTPVSRYLPSFAGPGKDLVTIRLLLAHAAGLPAWRALYREATSRSEAFALAAGTPLVSPPGSVETYSDLGAIVLTQVIETVYGERLDSLLDRRVFRPLGLTTLRYLPPEEWRDRIAPTELDPWRGRVLRGEVHDENAAAMHGVSGHAGLFGTAEDLLTFAEWLLARWKGPSVLREFSRRQDIVPGSSRALAWDTPSPTGSAGSRLSSSSFGHVGFTGTSLWIDPERMVGIVLLSNRVNPSRVNPRWAPVRGALADRVMTILLQDTR